MPTPPDGDARLFMPVVTDNLVFYHMPKAGGSTVENIIRASCARVARATSGQHNAPVDDHNRFYKGRLSFTCVRDPLHWMRSIYNWLTHNRETADMLGRCAILAACTTNHAAQGVVNYTDGNGFAGFIEKYLHDYSGVVTILYNDYALSCDRVIRTEDLPHAMIGILKEAGEEFDPIDVVAQPSSNASVSKDMLCHKWTGDLARRFIESEHTVFARWYPETLAFARGELSCLH